MPKSLQALQRITGFALLANAGLAILKLWGFAMSNSVALLSDGMNSLLDVASSAAVLISVRVGRTAPDREHPFGHSRAEPIAGFVIAIIACVLGVEVIQESVLKFLFPHKHEINAWLFGILATAIISKLAMATWQRRVGTRERSPALVALAVDSRNDVLSSIAALIGISGAAAGFQQADEIAGLVVGVLILYSGIQIIRENIDLLLGRAPSEATIASVRAQVDAVDGIEGIRFCRGHFVGQELHFEIIIACSGDLSTRESSEIADRARIAAESCPGVSVAFIHVDTVESPHHYPELLERLEVR